VWAELAALEKGARRQPGVPYQRGDGSWWVVPSPGARPKRHKGPTAAPEAPEPENDLDEKTTWKVTKRTAPTKAKASDVEQVRRGKAKAPKVSRKPARPHWDGDPDEVLEMEGDPHEEDTVRLPVASRAHADWKVPTDEPPKRSRASMPRWERALVDAADWGDRVLHDVHVAGRRRGLWKGTAADILARAQLEVDLDELDLMVKAHDLLDVQGLPVVVQYRPGDLRHGRPVTWPYGEIAGTLALDGQPLDVFLGPNPMAWAAYSMDGGLGEPKLFLGFTEQWEAELAFIDWYGRVPRCTQWALEELREVVRHRPDLQLTLLQEFERRQVARVLYKAR
jgi:hypothetical protein